MDLKHILKSFARPVALVGASMGSATGLSLLGTNPEQLAGALVLVDLAPTMNPGGVAKIKNFMKADSSGFASVKEVAEAVSAYNPHRPRPDDLSGLMKNLRRRADGRLYWHWDPSFISISNEALR